MTTLPPDDNSRVQRLAGFAAISAGATTDTFGFTSTGAGFAATRATLVLHLAVQRLDVLAPELAAHYGADCPVAVVAKASRDDELVLRGTLADIADQVAAAGVVRTAVVVVGPVLTAGEFPDSHLYSTTRER